MSLKALDLFVCLRLALRDEAKWTYAGLGQEIGLSASETNASTHRCVAAGLLVPCPSGEGKPQPMRQNLLEFIEHGARYAFYVSPGRVSRGIPTAHSGPPLDQLMGPGEAAPYVWPDPHGSARGQSILPLHRTVPEAALRDPELYEALALMDAIRVGRLRERKLAFDFLKQRIDRPRES